jgi:Rad3-related DNA helicase
MAFGAATIDDTHRLRAEEIKRQRIRAGTWSGGVRAHTEYQDRPLEWIIEKLGVPEHTLRWSLNEGYEKHEWDGDKDPLVRVLDALANWQDAGVESGTGTGKTYLSACIVLWFLACFEDSIVVTAAPKEDQLLKHAWKEIGRLYPRFEKLFPNSDLMAGVLDISSWEGISQGFPVTPGEA